MNNFQPLKITASLQTEIITDGYLPLDSILYYHFIRDNFGAQHKSKARESDVAEWSGKRLPILPLNLESKHEWFYSCSFAQWPDITKPGKHSYAKRFRTGLATKYIDFGGKRGNVYTNRGEYKNMYATEYTLSTPYVTWYCVGDKKKIETLLFFVTHIGKKSAQGCGSVLQWNVEAVDYDWSVENQFGGLTRAVPSGDGDTIYGIRPSYWLPRHQFRCHMPNLLFFL